MKKKWIALILGIVMVLGLCACTVNPEQASQNEIIAGCVNVDFHDDFVITERVISTSWPKHNNLYPTVDYIMVLENSTSKILILVDGQTYLNFDVGDTISGTFLFKKKQDSYDKFKMDLTQVTFRCYAYVMK